MSNLSKIEMVETALLSKRVSNIQPSPSMGAMAEIRRLRASGRQILDMTIGEPDFAPPQPVVEAGVEALRSGRISYVPTNGTAELRSAIIRKFEAENGLVYDDAQITVGAGAKQIIFAALAATLDPEDEVVFAAPYWVSYPDITRVFEGKPIAVTCDAAQKFKLTPTALRDAISDRTRWLILNGPANPSGSVYDRWELAALGSVLEEYPRILVLTDEIYEHFVYGGRQFTSFAAVNPHLHDRVLTVNGVSKAFGLAGLRLGYAGGPQWLIGAITKLISQDTSCANSIVQHAAAAALSGHQDFLQANRERYERRARMLVDGLNRIAGVSCTMPEGAFYVFPSVARLIGKQTPDGGTIKTDADLAKYLVSEAGVATMPGAAFGMSPFLRLSFATSDQTIAEAVAAIASAVAKLG